MLLNFGQFLAPFFPKRRSVQGIIYIFKKNVLREALPAEHHAEKIERKI